MNKKREEVRGVRRIENDKLGEQKYKEEYGGALESKVVEWEDTSDVEHI